MKVVKIKNKYTKEEMLIMKKYKNIKSFTIMGSIVGSSFTLTMITGFVIKSPKLFLVGYIIGVPTLIMSGSTFLEKKKCEKTLKLKKLK